MVVNAKVKSSSSTSKRQKSHGESGKHVCITGKECGIERLPEEILSHILSFLETKAAGQVSVLSKQWRYVWTSVPCIKLYNYPTSFDSIERLRTRLNTVSCLRSFCFIASSHCYLWWFRGLIDFVAAKCHIEELELGIGSGSVECPRTVFTCEKLVVLKLNEGIRLIVPSSSVVYLPSLKILHLCAYRELFCKDSMKCLLDACPLLEELNIKGVEDDRVSRGKKTLFIGSSSLKCLRIHSAALRWKDRIIVLDVPNVEQLDIAHHDNVEYEMKNISSLLKLTIRAHRRTLVKVLWKFAHTKYLTIYFPCFEYLRLDNSPKFHNLTHLVIHDINDNWPVLISLLEFLPKLVALSASSSCINCKIPSTQHHMQIKSPNCLTSYLEEIELTRFKGFVNEMEMARYFLKHSLVLKKLSIRSESGAKIHIEIANKILTLLTFPWGSPDCQIIVE